MPPRPTLLRLREAIAEEPKGFAAALSGSAFKRRFGRLSEEAMLVRLPHGFDPGNPAEPWLRYQSFTVSAPLTDAQVLDRKLAARVERDFTLMLPLVRWLNAALGYLPADRRCARCLTCEGGPAVTMECVVSRRR